MTWNGMRAPSRIIFVSTIATREYSPYTHRLNSARALQTSLWCFGFSYGILARSLDWSRGAHLVGSFLNY